MAQPRPGIDLTENVGPQMILSSSICSAFATLAVALRLLCRYLKGTRLTASDYLVVVGLAAAWVFTIHGYITINLGLGRHMEVVSVENLKTILRLTMVSAVFYVVTLVSVKISILLLYCSIFPGRTFTLVARVVGGLVVAWGIACFLVTIFSCQPVEGFWNITVPSTCIDAKRFYIGNSVPNIVMDVIILAMPVGEVWKLQLTPAKKLAIIGMFSLGGFVCVSSGVRLYFVLNLDLVDLPWGYYNVGTWSLIELDAAIISACLPTLRPLFHTMKERLTSRGSRSKESLGSREGGSSPRRPPRPPYEHSHRLQQPGWEGAAGAPRDPKVFYMSRVTAGSDPAVHVRGILRSTDIESQSQGGWGSPGLRTEWREERLEMADVEAQRR